MRAPLFLVALGLALSPLASLADDNPSMQSPANHGDKIGSPSFSGIYAGVHGGIGWGDTSIVDGGTLLGTPPNPPYGAFACGPALTGNYCNVPFDLGSDGLLGGIQVGANWQRGNIVFGIEGDVTLSGVDNSYTLVRPFDDSDYASVDFDWYGTVTGRIGYAADRTLFYAKGGAAFSKINITAADIDLVGGVPQIYQPGLTNFDGIETGWTLGGGIEWFLSDAVSVKMEYLYMDFGSATSTTPDGDIYHHKNRLQTINLGLNFHFPPH